MTTKTLFLPRVFISMVICVLAFNSGLYAQSFYFKSTELASPPSLHASNVVANPQPPPSSDNFMSAESDLWFKLYPFTPNNSIGKLKVKEIRSYVKLSIDRDEGNPNTVNYNKTVYNSYTYQVLYEITGYKTPGEPSQFDQFIDTLTISYKPDTSNAFQDVSMKSYYGYYKVEIKIIDVIDVTCLYQQSNPCPPPSAGFLAPPTLSVADMALNWKISLGIESQQFDKELPDGSGWKDLADPNLELNVQSTPSTTDNFLTVKWNVVPGQQPQPALYELEWTFVDNYGVTYSGTVNTPNISTIDKNYLTYNFNNNSTRVITDKIEYKIPLIYNRGYLIYRVRMLRPDENLYKNINYSRWSIASNQGTFGSLNQGSTSKYYYYVDKPHLNDKYNWNYQVSFAEEGKSKHIASYFDGLLKNRQTVTKFSSLPEQQIVSEQVYNYEGKPGLTMLPIPVANNALSFIPGFALTSSNVSYSAVDIDKLIAPPPVSALAPSSPAALYYSPNNIFYDYGQNQQWKYLKALPDAQGYPFIHTKYAPDDGRVTAQGGAGQQLQLGTGHDTKYFYLAPEQTELNKYFGVNIGKAQFYEKTITRDPNKQLSFSVFNNDGKVMMTGLMGFNPSPNTSALLLPNKYPTTEPTVFPATDLLYGQPGIWTGNVMKYNKATFFDKSGPIVIPEFKITMDKFRLCFDNGTSTQLFLQIPFKYNFRILNEYGNEVHTTAGNSSNINVSVEKLTNPSSINTTLVSLQSFNTGSVDAGKNAIDFTVSYDPADIDNAINTYLFPSPQNAADRPLCVKTEADFLKEAMDNINMDCETTGELSTCNMYKKLLMEQLMPMGKFGKYQERFDIVSGQTEGIIVGQNKSLFAIVGWDNTFMANNVGNDWEAYNYPTPPQNSPNGVPKPYYRYQHYIKSISPLGIVSHLSWFPGSGYSDLAIYLMDAKNLINIINTNFGFLEIHPEYCDFKNLYCDNGEFENKIQHIPDYQTAQSLGLNTLSQLVVADPLNAKYINSSTPNKLKEVSWFIDQSGNTQDISIDKVVMTKLFCNLGPDCFDFYNSLSSGQIEAILNGMSMSPQKQNQYYAELVSMYIANRQNRIAQYPSLTTPCTQPDYCIASQAISDYKEKVIVYMYNSGYSMNLPYGTLNDPDCPAGTKSIAQQMQYPTSYISGTYTTGNPSILQQVTPPNGNEQYADEIIKRLANCIGANNYIVSLPVVRSFILAHLNYPDNQNSFWKGNLTPDILKNILVDNGIVPDDLCNPYLVDYLENPFYNSAKCKEPSFYTHPQNLSLESTIRLFKTKMIAAVGAPNVIQLYGLYDYSNQTNPFNRELQNTFNGVPLYAKIIYEHGIMPENFVIYFDTDNSTASVNYDKAVSISLIDFTSNGTVSFSLANWSATFFSNNTTIGLSEMFVSGCAETDVRTNYIPFNGYFNAGEINNVVSFTGGIKGLKSTQSDLSHCLSCLEMKKAYEAFIADVQSDVPQPPSIHGYSIKGKGHPMFEISLRSFFNFYFKKKHTAQEYLNFIESCNLTETYRMNAYYAYLHAAKQTTASTNLVVDYLKNYDNGKLKNFKHFHYYDYSEAHLYVDFTDFPYAELRIIKDGIIQAVAANPIRPDMYFNHLETEVPNNSLTLGDVFVHYKGPNNDYNPCATTPTPLTASQLAALNWTSTLACDPNSNVNITFNSVTVVSGNYTYPYTKIHFSLPSIAASQSAQSLYAYNFINNLPGEPWGYTSFCSYQTNLNTDNLDNIRKNYLMHVYSPTCTTALNESRDKHLNLLMPSALQSTIDGTSPFTANYSPYQYVSYYNSNKKINAGDLYIRTQFGNNDGRQYVNSVIDAIENATGSSNIYFPNLNNVSFGGEQISVRVLPDNVYWYNIRNTTTGSHKNIWIQFPKFITAAQISQFSGVTGTLTATPNGASTRNFRYQVQGLNTSIEVVGKTDFDLTFPPHVFENVLLCDESGATNDTISTCYENQVATAVNNASLQYEAYISALKQSLANQFKEHIKNNLHTTIKMQMPQMAYQITLYDYDRAGNLTTTVPPEGVATVNSSVLNFINERRDLLANGTLQPILLPSAMPFYPKQNKYQYNSQNQLINQTINDAGTTEFFYDAAGRLIFSENAQQKKDRRIAYNLYDEQSRVIETGVLIRNPNVINVYIEKLRNYDRVDYGDIVNAIYACTRQDVIRTYYDGKLTSQTQAPLPLDMPVQENLRGRVAAVASYTQVGANTSTPDANYNVALHYSYDLSGNVKTMIYDMPALVDVLQRYKRIDYDYDLYSGKVTLVSYNRSYADQFYQRYEYDDDNRITKVETSQDGLLWDEDAVYKYYPHGPLARISLGDLKVQGIDFAYTLQGWLKAVNGDNPTPINDIGADGTSTVQHQEDLIRNSLYYFSGDYVPIDPANFTNTQTRTQIPDITDDPTGNIYNSLYNGNIAAALTIPGYFPALYTSYKYDQLNRLRNAYYQFPEYPTQQQDAATLTNFSDIPLSGTLLSNSPGHADSVFSSKYHYDMDGNLTFLRRFGLASNDSYNYTSSEAFLMDDLTYYPYSGTSNKLVNYGDAANYSAVVGFTNDLPYSTGSATTYAMQYDLIGNLISDAKSNISNIRWNQYGKVSTVSMMNLQNITYGYDPLNNRLSKTIELNGGENRNSEYYIRDASGNILAVYTNRREYKLTKPYLNIIGQIITKPTFAEDIAAVMAPDGQFTETLLTGISGTMPTVEENIAQGVDAAYYIEHSPVMKSVFIDETPDVIPGIIDFSPGIITNWLADGFHDPFFHPFTIAPNLQYADLHHYIRLLVDDEETDLQNVFIEHANLRSVKDYDDFVEKLLDHFVHLGDPEDILVLIKQALQAKGNPEEPYLRLLSDFSYRESDFGSGDLPDVGSYVRQGLKNRDNGPEIASFANEDIEAANTFIESNFDITTRVGVVYAADPASVIQMMKEQSGADELLDQALESTDNMSPTTLLLRLMTVRPSDLDYPTMNLMQVLQYNKFSLAEHHIYGSSRLGIKKHWADQYSYAWDATLSTQGNADLLAASAFSYRRPWYTPGLNSLVPYTVNSPYVNGYNGILYSRRVLGQKRYELTNHLGNVQAVVSDKIIQTPPENTPLPVLSATTRATLLAAYDYYPFGMLMPQRWQEDQLLQCTPVTSNIYIKTLAHLTDVSFTAPTIAPFAASATTGVHYAQGAGENPGYMVVWGNGGNGPEVTAHFNGGGSFGQGKQVRVETGVDNSVLGTDVDVELRQQDPINGYVILATARVAISDQLTLEGTLVNSGPVEVVYRAEDPGQFFIKKTVLKTIDVATYSTTRLECDNTDLNSNYRFGFNGQEKENERQGVGNFLDFGARGYDSRLGRFQTLDPLFKRYPGESPYSFAGNSPIHMIDLYGETKKVYTYTFYEGIDKPHISVVTSPGLISRKNYINTNNGVLGMRSPAAPTYDWFDYTITNFIYVDKNLHARKLGNQIVTIGQYRTSTENNWEWWAKSKSGDDKVKEQNSFSGLIGYSKNGGGLDNIFNPRAGKGSQYVDFGMILNAMKMANMANSSPPSSVLDAVNYLNTSVDFLLDNAKPTTPVNIDVRTSKSKVVCPGCTNMEDSGHVDNVNGAGTFDRLKKND